MRDFQSDTIVDGEQWTVGYCSVVKSTVMARAKMPDARCKGGKDVYSNMSTIN